MKKSRAEQVETTTTKLVALNNRNIPIIVEGINDELALRALGVVGNIIWLKGTLPDIVSHIDAMEVIVLTDCDRRGNFLAGRISMLLINEGIVPNLKIRAKLRTYVGMRFVEELPSLLLNLKTKNKRR